MPTVPTPDSSAAHERAHLDRSLLKGIAWTSIANWISQALTWASTLVVIRHLTREDYGLVTMAAVYFGLVRMTSELGLGAAVIQYRNLTRDQISQFHGLSILAGVVSLAISALVAFPLGWFFEEPQLPMVVLVMSSVFLIASLRVVPQALQQREMEFRKVALVDSVQSLAAAVATMTMAIAGFGYWTLALGPVVSAIVAVLLVRVQVGPTPIAWPKVAAIRGPLTFSSQMLATRLAWYGYSSADSVIVGKLMGSAALGAYGVASSLGSIAVEKVTALIVRVTPSVFSAVQHDRAEMRRYLRAITEVLSILTFPACVGMALVAEDLVRLALGPVWTSAIRPMQLLAILATVRSIGPLIQQVLAALGEARLNLENALITIVILPLAFLVALPYDLTGIAVAWLIVAPILFARLVRLALVRIDMTPGAYLASLWPATSACLVMAAAVTFVDRVLLEGAPLYTSLFVKIGVGALAYTAALLILHRRRIEHVRGMVRALRARRAVPAAPADPVAVNATVDL
jgi:PST family polysaccharide transporter